MMFKGLLLYYGTLWAKRDYGSITCVHVLGLNTSLDTLDIRVYFPTNMSEYSMYQHTQLLGGVMTVTLII